MKEIMKRKDVINAIVKAVEVGLKKSDAAKIYQAIFSSIADALKEDQRVKIGDIGTLSLTTRKPTTYRNPQTKEVITKEAHKRIKFSMSKTMKEEINNNG